MSLRVMFNAPAGVGHVFPQVPLAWALQALGHEVLMVTGGPGLVVERAGILVADFTPGLVGWEVEEEVIREHPDHLAEVRGSRIRNFTEGIHRVSRVARVGLDETVRIAEAWRPDLVVHDPLTIGGLVAAARLGVPSVEHGFGFARTTGLAEMYLDHLRADFERHGVSALPTRRAKIDIAPASMLSATPEEWPMRPISRNGGAILPEWLVGAGPLDRPRVAVTLGTVLPMAGGLGPFTRIAEAAEGIDADFVFVLGADDRAGLGALPPNVRAEGWLPFGALVARCTAAVHHGGSGATMAALTAGVPSVVLPGGADNYANADAVTTRGAGLTSTADDVDEHVLRQLVEDEKLRRNAAEVHAEIQDMPTPFAVVSRIEDLVA